ncbi:MAG: GFA family protein [Sphingomonadaceae bacterium]
MTHSGQCLCGAVTLRIDVDHIAARMCWCRDCQYIANGSATVNAVFPHDSVHFDGEIRTFSRMADSGNMVERGFCPACGTQLFSRTVATPTIRIRVGVLDNPSAIVPQGYIWTASKPDWAHLDPALPALSGPPA